MHKIRGAHFVLAFLAVILLPVFLGAAELPDYQKYTGPIKPGVVITKANWDTYLPELKELLPQSKLKYMSMGVKEGLVTMPIVKTTYSHPTKGQMEATRKYAGTARVGADNQLTNWVAGFPQSLRTLRRWPGTVILPSPGAAPTTIFFSTPGLACSKGRSMRNTLPGIYLTVSTGEERISHP